MEEDGADALVVEALGEIKTRRDPKGPVAEQRAIVVQELRKAMNTDLSVMRGVITVEANWPEAVALWPKKKKRDKMVEKVRQNIDAGLGLIQRQPLDEYLT